MCGGPSIIVSVCVQNREGGASTSVRHKNVFGLLLCICRQGQYLRQVWTWFRKTTNCMFLVECLYIP